MKYLAMLLLAALALTPSVMAQEQTEIVQRNPVTCGERFAYIQDEMVDGNLIDGISKIYLLHPNGSATLESKIIGLASNITCSPDGELLAYAHFDDSVGRGYVWVEEIDDPQDSKRVVATPPCPTSAVAFSPNGEWLAFSACSMDPNNHLEKAIFRVNVADETIEQLTQTGEQFVWVSDNELIYEAASGITLVDIETKTETLLIGNGTDAAVSPDGSVISFLIDGSLSVISLDDSEQAIYDFDTHILSSVWYDDHTLLFSGWVNPVTTSSRELLSGLYIFRPAEDREPRRILTGTFVSIAIAQNRKQLAVEHSSPLGRKILQVDVDLD